MKTFISKIKKIKHNWYIVEAEGKVLGRLATVLARYLIGKHKVNYAPYLDMGDYIIVLNADKIITTGNKFNDKIYYHYTGHVGGIKKIPLKEMISYHPERVIKIAVKGMLPRGPLGRVMLRKLKVYAGNKHKHEAQQPQFLDI